MGRAFTHRHGDMTRDKGTRVSGTENYSAVAKAARRKGMTRGKGRMTWPVLAMAVVLACLLALTGCPSETSAPKVTGVMLANEGTLVKTLVAGEEYAKPAGLKLTVVTDDGKMTTVNVTDGMISVPADYKNVSAGSSFTVTVTYEDPLYPGNRHGVTYQVSVVAPGSMTVEISANPTSGAVDGWLDLAGLELRVGHEGASQSDTVAYGADTKDSFLFFDGATPLATDGGKLSVGFGSKTVKVMYTQGVESAQATLAVESTLSAPTLTASDKGNNAWDVTFGHPLRGESVGSLEFHYETTYKDVATGEDVVVDKGTKNGMVTVTYTDKVLTLKAKAVLTLADGTKVESEYCEGMLFAPKLAATTVVVDGPKQVRIDGMEQLGWTVTFTYGGSENDVSLKYSVLADGVAIPSHTDKTAGTTTDGLQEFTVPLAYGGDLLTDKALTVKAYAKAEGYTDGAAGTAGLAKQALVSPTVSEPLVREGTAFWEFTVTSDKDVGQMVTTTKSGSERPEPVGTTTDDVGGTKTCTYQVPYDAQVDAGKEYAVKVVVTRTGYGSPSAVEKCLVPPGQLASPALTSTRTDSQKFTVAFDGVPSGGKIQYQTVRNTKDGVPAADGSGWTDLGSGSTSITVDAAGQWGVTVYAKAVKEGAIPSEVVKSDPLLVKLDVSGMTQRVAADGKGWITTVTVAQAPGLLGALRAAGTGLGYTYRIGTNATEHKGTIAQDTLSDKLEIPVEDFGDKENRKVTVTVGFEGYEDSEGFEQVLDVLTLPVLTIGNVTSSEKDGNWYWTVPLSGGQPGANVIWSVDGKGDSFTLDKNGDDAHTLDVPYVRETDESKRTLSLNQSMDGFIAPAEQTQVLDLHQIAVTVKPDVKPVKDEATGKYSWTVELKSDVAGATYTYSVGNGQSQTETSADGSYVKEVTVDAGDGMTEGSLKLTKVSKDGFLTMESVKTVKLLAMGKLSTPAMTLDTRDEFDWKVTLTNQNDSGTLKYRYTTDADGTGGNDGTSWSAWKDPSGDTVTVSLFADDQTVDKVKFEAKVESTDGENVSSDVAVSDVYGRTAEPDLTYGYMDANGNVLDYTDENKAKNLYPVVTAGGAANAKVRMQLSYEAVEDKWWPAKESDQKASAKVAVTKADKTATVTAEAREDDKMGRKATSNEMTWTLPEGGYKVGDIGPTGGIILKAENGSYAEGSPIPGLDQHRLYYCNYQDSTELDKLKVLAAQFGDDANSGITRETWKEMWLDLGHTQECMNDVGENRCYLYRILHGNEGNSILNVDLGGLLLSGDMKDLHYDLESLVALMKKLASPEFLVSYPDSWDDVAIDFRLMNGLSVGCNDENVSILYNVYDNGLLYSGLGYNENIGWTSSYSYDMTNLSYQVESTGNMGICRRHIVPTMRPF